MKKECNITSSSSFEIIAGSIIPGQKILVVDDCIASGSTVVGVSDLITQQGGIITKIVCLIEFPDLGGRHRIMNHHSGTGRKDVEFFSLIQFPGR